MASFFWKVAVLYLCFFISSSAANISPPSGVLCVGQVENYTCNFASSSTLVWGYTGVPDVLFTSAVNSTRPLGDYITVEYVPSATGVVSRATVNISSININETTLHCRNSLAVTGSTSQNIVFNVKGSSPATVMSIIRNSSPPNISVIVNWGGATCVPMYRISIRRGQSVIFDDDVTSLEFTYSVSAYDTYAFSVSSYNYFGQIIGNPLDASVCVSTPNFNVSIHPNYDSNTISIVIQDTSVCTVPDTSYSVLLTNGSSYNETRSNTLRKVFLFPNIVIGRQYTYSATATNLFGSYRRNGTAGIPELSVIVSTIKETATIFATATINKTAIATISTTVEPNFSHISPLSVIILVVIGTLLMLSVFWIVLSVIWRSRRAHSQFWNNGFWSFIFCDCNFKGNENDTKTIPLNKRSDSPEVVKQTVSEM